MAPILLALWTTNFVARLMRDLGIQIACLPDLIRRYVDQPGPTLHRRFQIGGGEPLAGLAA